MERKVIAAGIVGGLAGGLVVAAIAGGIGESRADASASPAGAAAEVRARGFLVVDSSGKVRGRLGCREDGGVALNLFGSDGKGRVAAIVFGRGGAGVAVGKSLYGEEPLRVIDGQVHCTGGSIYHSRIDGDRVTDDWPRGR